MPNIPNVAKHLAEGQNCAYCLEPISDEDLERKRIWSPNWRAQGGQSPPNSSDPVNRMKNLIALFILTCVSALAQNVSMQLPLKMIVHPKQFSRDAGVSNVLLALSSVTLEAANYGDYRTTYKGVVQGSFCELNPAFQTAQCGTVVDNLNLPKFRGAKIGLALIPVAEYLPRLFHFHNSALQTVEIIANFAGSAVIGSIAIHNEILLGKSIQ